MNLRILLFGLVLFFVFQSNAMQSRTEDPNQTLLNAIQTNDEAAAVTALHNGASPKGRKVPCGDSFINSHQPIYDTISRDNVAIFKLLIPYYDSIAGWEYPAKQDNATNIVAYIKDHKNKK